MAEDRRTLLKVLTGAVGACAAAAVGVPAIQAVVAPWNKKTVSGTGEFLRVAPLSSVPEDGSPVNAPIVVQAPRDAWNKLPPTRVGAVFLHRNGDDIVAMSSICPHLGCGIDYVAERAQYACPCHESFFDAGGKVKTGPSPRGMDTLQTRVVDGYVEVRFEKFKIGTNEKVSV